MLLDFYSLVVSAGFSTYSNISSILSEILYNVKAQLNNAHITKSINVKLKDNAKKDAIIAQAREIYESALVGNNMFGDLEIDVERTRKHQEKALAEQHLWKICLRHDPRGIDFKIDPHAGRSSQQIPRQFDTYRQRRCKQLDLPDLITISHSLSCG